LARSRGSYALVGLLAVSLASCAKKEQVQSFPVSFVGVGLELRIDGNAPVVVKALAGGPAAVAGVQPGDRVTAIDGQATQGQTLGDVVMRLRGEPESQVQMTIERGGERVLVVIRRRAMEKGAAGYVPAQEQVTPRPQEAAPLTAPTTGRSERKERKRRPR
jgi:C-terminal processing protease CtpA/Prc